MGIQKFAEIVNGAEILQTLYLDEFIYDFDEAGIPTSQENEEWEFVKIEKDLDVDTHKCYEISASVYELKINSVSQGYFKIYGVTNVFRGSMDWEDCGHKYSVVAVEPFDQVVTVKAYRPIT
jgi:hypothetical protein